MEYLLYIIIGILLVVILALLAKVYFLRKSAGEIAEGFRDRLTADTNTLIDISSGDPYMRKLAAEINVQLRELRRQRHRYHTGDLELKEAVTNISHDIRTPLTVIRGYLDLLHGEELSETAARYLCQIEDRTEAMTALTEELFRYSIVTSTEALSPEPLNLSAALSQSLLSFYGTFQQRSIIPEIMLPEEPIIRILDASALGRIFSNIISNALKYSAGDFSVTLTETGQIHFSNTAPDLTPVTLGRLFDRFYTVEASRNSTGLGLSIAKQLTERMGGSIDASLENQRFTITLTFPET